MPEGHTVHRLAAAFDRGFAGQRVRTSSPQGRFTEAAAIDGQVLLGAEAVGKHLLLNLAPSADVDPEDPVVRRVHVHLGLYGSWTFAGEPGFALGHAIGAPRVHVGEQERAVGPDEPEQSASGPDPSAWRRLVPRETVRLRVQGPNGLADLTGPTACRLIDAEERAALLARLGPDPLRADADPARFVHRVLRSRTPIGVLLMNQDVIAGVGNIYRAEALFRARLDPWTPGNTLTRGIVEGIWEDLVPLMEYGVRTGRIVTVQPEHRHIEARIVERARATRQNDDDDPAVVPREESFYVYHRQTLPCRLCGAVVKDADMAGRTVFWCPRCQSARSRRSPWTRQNPPEWAREEAQRDASGKESGTCSREKSGTDSPSN